MLSFGKNFLEPPLLVHRSIARPGQVIAAHLRQQGAKE
jgi:hypothetical protein